MSRQTAGMHCFDPSTAASKSQHMLVAKHRCVALDTHP
jgi:hypothetical protein